MELLLRVHHGGEAPRDLQVDLEPTRRVADLATALARTFDPSAVSAPTLTLGRTGRRLDPDATVAEEDLLSGDEVVLGPTAPAAPMPPVPIRAVSLDVLAGPDSGHSAVLDRGRYVLGRDETNDISFGDATVSRRHLEVEVAADWTVWLTPDADSENGVLVNDRRIDERTAVTGDDVVTLGTTRLAFREFIRAVDEAVDRLGQIEFHRTPYRPVKVRPRELDPLGPVPARPEPRRFQVFSIIAPIGAGLALFAMFQRAYFLAIILISPLAMVGTWWEDRRSGRKKYSEQAAAFRHRIVEYTAEVFAALEQERIERLRSAPDLADLARRAELRTIDLWPRGRADEDFSTVRIGLGDTTSLVTASVAPNGEDELREEALAALVEIDEMRAVPVTVSFPDAGTVAVHGDPGRVDDVAASMLVQLACLHSPEDLIVAAAVDPTRSFSHWTKWLPHTRSATSPLAGQHLHTATEGCDRLLAEVIEVAELRIAESDRHVDRRWPWLVVVLDGDLEPDPTLVSHLLDRGGAGGVSVLWLCTNEGRVPRQATSIVDCQLTDERGRSLVWHTDPDRDPQWVELGRVHPDVADRVARSLAPVRDASVATATTAIPRTVPLLSVLGSTVPDADSIAASWRTDRGYSLDHPVGIGPDGVFSLDLVADGPHALIGGTSGAGKSELLQAIVASLVTRYPPSRLNLLFVDYKGGASSTVFRPVPHTVGYVTNLDAALSLRALTSLRAELDRRMRLMEGRAKDLEEMLAQHPDEAPPSLVIVVDEFATLAKEVPEFVAGVVDIAQRGRSLGIHLILATQRPSGSINDNILANTNVRISLRMLDASESNAVIASPEAAQIPVPLRGRAFARLGPRALVPFQSAYASAPLGGDGDGGTVVVRRFDPDDRSTLTILDDRDGDDTTTGRSQLDAVIDAVVEAHERTGAPPQRAPWREMLDDHITLDHLREDPRAVVGRSDVGRRVVLGVVDHPERQDQYPLVVDLEESGGLVVFGSGGSGKTTLLRTVATAAALDADPSEVVVFGLDFASRALRSIEVLPHVAAVASGDDLEAVTRVIALLERELERRRSVLGESQAETLSAHQAAGGSMPRILLLVDGLENLVATFTGGSFGSTMDAWLSSLQRIVLDGRQVGIHSVLTASRRNGVPAVINSSIGERVILRQADQSAYADVGLPAAQAKDLDLPSGRGLWHGTQLLQIACVSTDGDGRAQALDLRERASAMRGGEPTITTTPLPERVGIDRLPGGSSPTSVQLGLADLTLAPVAVDLEHSHMFISGLARSGRSTAAMVMVDGLRAAGHEVWTFGPAASPLMALNDRRVGAFGRAEALQPVLEELAQLVETTPGASPRFMVIDDLDAFEDMSLGPLWERLAGSDALRVVATIENRSVSGFSTNALLNTVRKARRALVLQPDDAVEFFQMTGVKAPLRPGTSMPPGRGVLLVDRRPTVVQVAQLE
ncbi:MAG: FtsK/SpoIIIE domain-containing protein [Acidimicrobiales bacterium]